MKITEVRIFQKEEDDKKLRAFATVTFDDCFVVRDIKIIEGSKGCFVAMPSRRVKEPCPRCHHRNVVRARYCNQCGASLEAASPRPKAELDEEGTQSRLRQSEHRDIAHPITAEFRETIQRVVLEAYEKEKVK
ncbi:MAG: septation protein SpoVG family protein [Candidatus Omnitrophica bacterium]|nr:septation protein SpoVG family protein [Candidatus Omnitrophota bacterium]